MRDMCIVGGGAVGMTLAYFIYASGGSRPIVFYRREEEVREVRDRGGFIYRNTAAGKVVHVPVEPVLLDSSVADCEYLFNAVKAYGVESTIPYMKRVTRPGDTVVMLQNGFGPLEAAEEKLADRTVAAGVVYFGAEKISATEVVHHGGNLVIAGTRIGLGEKLAWLPCFFRRGGLEFRVVGDIDFYRWLKLALNAVVNPLTAITRSRNRVVLTPEGIELAKMILEEVAEAAKLRGYFLDRERVLKNVLYNIELTKNNYSSMAQDVMKGGPTEIDYINGFVARVLGDKAPVNTVITLLVKLVEKRGS